jgi:hypothetical protein
LRFAGDHEKNRRGALRRGVHGKASAGESGPALRPAPRAPLRRSAAPGPGRLCGKAKLNSCEAPLWSKTQANPRAAAPPRIGERTMFVSAIEDIISIGTGKSGLNAI